MAFLAALWLPILVASVLVFFAGFVIWVVLPHHNNDWPPVTDERIAAVIREHKMWGGQYSFPADRMSKDPEVQARNKGAPTGFLLTQPEGGSSMLRVNTQYFLFNLLVLTFIAYLAYHALPAGAAYADVFRIVGTATVLAYALPDMRNAIFWAHTWQSVWKQVGDGVVYAILAGGVFAWLWPG